MVETASGALFGLLYWQLEMEPQLAIALVYVSILIVIFVIDQEHQLILDKLSYPAMPLALVLLVYSLFLELPFRKTYVGPGHSLRLVTTGTYELVRHPTVLWYGLLLLSLLLLARSQFLLIALPLWLVLDVLWVVFQERLSLLPNIPEYYDYRQTTPMLIPNLRSIRACLTSFGLIKGVRAGPMRR